MQKKKFSTRNRAQLGRFCKKQQNRPCLTILPCYIFTKRGILRFLSKLPALCYCQLVAAVVVFVVGVTFYPFKGNIVGFQ